MNKKAIIIGAGPAGLTAAYKLLKETDIKPIILEESNVVGGISQTVNYKGNRMDLGGHRFFTKNEEVNKIWQELMILQSNKSKDDILLNRNRIFKGTDKNGDPEINDNVFLLRNRVSRIFYKRKFFDYPISMKAQTFINMGFIDTMRGGFGYLASLIHKREEKSLEDFYVNRFGKPLYSMFFEKYTEKLWGVHPSRLSADWGAQRVKGLSISKVLKEALCKPFKKGKTQETSLIEEFEYPKYGPGQLYQVMAEKIIEMGGEIIYNTKVKTIEFNGNNIKSINNKYTGDYYISSMPIKDLFMSFDTNVPDDIYQSAINLPYRDFITVGLLLKKLDLKNKTKIETVNNIVPDCWIYMQEPDLKIGRMQIFNNWSPYLVKDFNENVWIGLEYFCTEGDKFWNMTDEEFIELAINELIKIKVISKEDIIDSTRIKVKKAYPAYFGTYNKINDIQQYLNNIENLYCVGRNGQHRYNNMDHSMLTSIEAINLIKENNKDKSILWKVNTEKEYHETKNN